MKLRIPATDSEGVDMTPMIDIVFQLIIFFMVASSFVEEAKVFKVKMPKGEAPATISTEEAVRIAVTSEGKVAPADAVDKADGYESLQELVEDLKDYKTSRVSAKKEPVVVIAGDQEARHKRIIEVWNAVKTAGIQQVSFQVAAGKPDDEGE